MEKEYIGFVSQVSPDCFHSSRRVRMTGLVQIGLHLDEARKCSLESEQFFFIIEEGTTNGCI
jgi:hypothetical protein